MKNSRGVQLHALAIILLIPCFAGNLKAEELQVKLHETKTDDGIRCRFEVVNHSQQPVVALAIGGNENMAGPYEFPIAPSDWDTKEGRVSDPRAAPPGWDPSLLAEEGMLDFAFEWQTKESEAAIQPGKSYDAFAVSFRRPATTCRGVHWTVITRDSQVISGMLQ